MHGYVLKYHFGFIGVCESHYYRLADRVFAHEEEHSIHVALLTKDLSAVIGVHVFHVHVHISYASLLDRQALVLCSGSVSIAFISVADQSWKKTQNLSLGSGCGVACYAAL